HPLQNRVPRGERAPVALCREPTEAAAETKSFCPCQKSQVLLLRYLTFFVSGWNVLATRRGCALRSACRGVSERQWRSAANRPRRQPRQVLLPLPKKRRKH